MAEELSGLGFLDLDFRSFLSCRTSAYKRCMELHVSLMMELVSLGCGGSEEEVGWNEDNSKALERLWVSVISMCSSGRRR